MTPLQFILDTQSFLIRRKFQLHFPTQIPQPPHFLDVFATWFLLLRVVVSVIFNLIFFAPCKLLGNAHALFAVVSLQGCGIHKVINALIFKGVISTAHALGVEEKCTIMVR